MLIAPGTKPTLFHFDVNYKESLQNRPVKWNTDGLSEFTFIRTYARTKANGKLESWNDCVIRVIEGQFSILKTYAKINHIPWNEKRAQKLSQESANRMFCFKWLPPGRGLWMMGTDFIWERGSGCLNNCYFISTEALGESVEETLFPFEFLMDMSMLGGGVGFDTKGAKNNVVINGFTDEVETFVVQDTREGWIAALSITLKNGIYGGPRIELDTHLVRGPGEPIRGFGGVSSGPGPLIMMIKGITDILQSRKEQFLTSVTITDIMNLEGKCVVSGNVRRSSEIAFSEADDSAFFEMKNWSKHPVEMDSRAPDELRDENPEDYELYNTNIWNASNGVKSSIIKKYNDRPWAYKFGGWRQASNNSILAKVGMNYSKLEPSIKESGEPGLAWLELMQAYGRMKDPINNKDHRAKGGNPCLEQTLESGEGCNLVENFPSLCEDYWDFQRTLKFSYLYAKCVTLMGTHIARTNAIMIRNRRIGCSMSGITDAIVKFSRTKVMQEFCDKGYNYIQYLDNKYSDWLGVPESIKKTSIKPSGTVSLVAGVYGPGAHFAKIKTGFRLVRVPANSPLIPLLIQSNYKVEPALTDPLKTSVVYFPLLPPEHIITEDETTIWEKFKMAADLQYWWADNQVSCTVEFTKIEGDKGEITRCLEAFDGQLKGISLLPAAEGIYQQMPYTRAARKEVEEYRDNLFPLDFTSLTEEGENFDANRFCDGDHCVV